MLREQPVASSSRLPPAPATPAQPQPQPARRSLSVRRRRAVRHATTIAFVLALTAPYHVTASPVRNLSGSGHDPHFLKLREAAHHGTRNATTQWTQSSVGDSLALPQSALKAAAVPSLATRQTTPHPLPERQWAQFGIARFDDVQQTYRLPEGYVILRQTMHPGFIVLSYLISLVGSLCTLELLIRRTSNRGISNIILLASAGICFGAVSTFALHFVGNQSLALHHPNQDDDPDFPTIYLSYNAGYTILSLVASCLAMIFAFFAMGTDIRLGRCSSGWWCSNDRKSLRRSQSTHSREETNPWKLHKAKMRKSANVGTIFQQAGMMPSWSLMEGPSRRYSAQGWRDLVPWIPQRKPSVQDWPVGYNAGPMDEDTIIRQDKDLNELDFRHGRIAVRDELDRRALHVDTAPPTTIDDTPMGSVNSMQQMHMQMQMQMQMGSDQQYPFSPLESYYPAGTPQSAPLTYHSHSSPAFNLGYAFPPRNTDSTSNLINSTTNLLPHNNEPLAPPPAILGPTAVGASNGLPPAILQNGRRASLPVISPPYAPRMATLTRIQSLPEPDPDMSPIPRTNHHMDASKNAKKNIASSGSSSDATTGDYDHEAGMYDDESDFGYIDHSGWRQRLLLKIQAGLPLTRLEVAERFLGLDVVTWTEVFKIFITGMVAGWGVAAMHYIGQVSINDIPYIAYKVGYVVGSVIIASGAVIIALYIMFIMLRPKLKHSWSSKIAVAILLAGAVCGMHYMGMQGTVYGWEKDRRPNSSTAMSGTKRAITGIVSALAFIAGLGVTTFVVINSIRDRKERARRRRVVVASVLLDDQDRMLVSAIDGLLPMCDIASLSSADNKTKSGGVLSENASSIETSGLGVDLTTNNEAFLHAMKMSWSWRNPFWSSLNPFASVFDIVGGLDNATTPPPPVQIPLPPATPVHQQLRGSVVTTGTMGSAISGTSVPTRLNIARFLEKFAVSATQLSVRLTGKQEGLSRLGVLYDQILTTGWVRLRNGKDTVSKGQLIFLVRRVNSDQERSDLLSRHFIFADTTSVATSLHKTLSTPFDHVLPFLEDMRTFCDRTIRMSLRPNTLYAGVAVVQATPFDGLRILLNHKGRSQLPMREVCTFSTLPGLPVDVAEGLAGTLQEIGEAVTWLDGMSLLSVITRNMRPESISVGGPRVGRLLAGLEKAVVPLLDELLSQNDMAYILPRLTLHPVLVPLTPACPSRMTNPGWAAPHVVVFYANYDFAVNTFADKWLPFSLFRAQNECVMAGAIDRINRAAEAASNGPRTPRAPSPAVSPVASTVAMSDAKFPTSTYMRRPSKVQFTVPTEALGNYSFPPKDGASSSSSHAPLSSTYGVSPLASSRDRQPPRHSSLSKNPVRYEPDYPGEHMRTAGVAEWNPNWLINLLRARLRADA